jgi:hypothetical protein
VSLVRQRFLLHESAAAADRMRKAEELLMDFLTHEGQSATRSASSFSPWRVKSLAVGAFLNVLERPSRCPVLGSVDYRLQACSNATFCHAQFCAAQGVLDAGADGDVRSWCEELDNFREAIAHKSILWLTLMACAQVWPHITSSPIEPPTDTWIGFVLSA